MRRWLAMLLATAVVALGGVALAVGGESPDQVEVAGSDEGADEKPEVKVELSEKDLEIPDGMLGEDEIPAAKEPVGEKPVEQEPVDDTPPEIVVLHPVDGQVFEQKEVVFEGETEPGAQVFAAGYEAEVSETGAWRIVLYLSKGKNEVTFKAVDAAGNHATASVTVIYEVPEKETPKPAPPKEKPKEEPKEEPKEKPAEWEFSAHQSFGECSETPPYDVFYGTGKPGTRIDVKSEFGSGVTEVDDKGHWEIKVIFESAPVGKVFVVKVYDDFGHKKAFEFVHTD